MKTDTLLVAVVAAAAACGTGHAFQNQFRRHALASPPTSSAASSPLFAAQKKKNGGSTGGGGGKGFGASVGDAGASVGDSGDGDAPEEIEPPKYSIDDKSYGTPPRGGVVSSERQQDADEIRSSMDDFFAAHDDWKPLFRAFASDATTTNSNDAPSFLSDETREHPLREEGLWGVSTLEGRNPWRLLASKPTSDSSLATIAAFLDEWQRSLLDIPLDSIMTGDNDMHFLEEGRRTIAVTRFHVLGEESGAGEGGRDWETELFRTCWSELAHLASQDEPVTGSLVLLPDNVAGGDGGLDRARDFVEENVIKPIRWLGRHEDWEISAMERGSLAVRLLYKLNDIPDLGERNSGGDERVTL